MGFADRHNVFYVRFPGAAEFFAGVWTPDHLPQTFHNSLLDGLGIAIVRAIIGRASMLGGHHKAAPSFDLGQGHARSCQEQDDQRYLVHGPVHHEGWSFHPAEWIVP